MTTILPRDSNDHPIPALRLKTGGAHAIAAVGTSARNTTAFDAETRVISLYATAPAYLAFGDSSVTAASSDHYFPSGVYYDVAIGGEGMGQFTHLAVLAVNTDGHVYVSEKV